MSKLIDSDKLSDLILVPPGKQISLAEDYDPAFKPENISKQDAKELLQEGIERIAELQNRLYAQNTYALLIILQAMDAAGKDSLIKHVMSGLNPQGCQVFSFKTPSAEELDHDYLWRCSKSLPERGRVGIFNRSYYEEVLITRVHPAILERQQLPLEIKHSQDIWKSRFEQINNFEKYLVENGIVIVKFFLNVSKEEQKQRFLERIDRPEKNWKFSIHDAKERAYWDDYMAAYEDMLNHTSTHWAPWYTLPADHKWVTRLFAGMVIYHSLERLNLHYPTVSEDHKQQLWEAKALLQAD